MKLITRLAIGLTMLTGAIFGTTGCASQGQIAALVGTVGNAISAVESIEGNTALAQKLTTDFSAAQTAVLNWKSGTPDTDAIEALNLVESDLNLIPISTTDQELIDLAIGTTESIIDLLPQSATPSLSVKMQRRVALSNAPHSSRAFKKQWNAIVKVHPELSKAKLHESLADKIL